MERIMRVPRNFDRSITYYLAGPMTGLPNYNYPAFEEVERQLVAKGLTVKSPHRNAWPAYEPDSSEFYSQVLRDALNLLLTCEGLILLKGWTRSRGAMVEYYIAQALGMPIYLVDGTHLVRMDAHTEEEYVDA